MRGLRELMGLRGVTSRAPSMLKKHNLLFQIYHMYEIAILVKSDADSGGGEWQILTIGCH